jgi:hypothetical protein
VIELLPPGAPTDRRRLRTLQEDEFGCRTQGGILPDGFYRSFFEARRLSADPSRATRGPHPGLAARLPIFDRSPQLEWSINPIVQRRSRRISSTSNTNHRSGILGRGAGSISRRNPLARRKYTHNEHLHQNPLDLAAAKGQSFNNGKAGTSRKSPHARSTAAHG